MLLLEGDRAAAGDAVAEYGEDAADGPEHDVCGAELSASACEV